MYGRRGGEAKGRGGNARQSVERNGGKSPQPSTFLTPSACALEMRSGKTTSIRTTKSPLGFGAFFLVMGIPSPAMRISCPGLSGAPPPRGYGTLKLIVRPSRCVSVLVGEPPPAGPQRASMSGTLKV